MRNIVNSYVRRFRTERRRSRRAIAMLLALALLVATGVTWQLHSTGIALTNETYCGQEEHTHTEECYGTVLSCGLAESEGHTHTADCYETVTTLVCGLEESVGHTHDESCYDEEGNLICGQEESEGHTHTGDCYVTEQVLICGLEESEGHTHTEECYETQLICGLEEHTHTVECLIDETADVETASDWEATIPSLSGDWAEDLVSVAKSQLGYAESTANYTLADDGETHKGYTRYGAWYGNKYGDWDAMFVSFCLHYAGVPASYVTQASGAYAWTAALSGSDYYTTASDYTPEPGDIVFFDRNSDGVADCTGIVITVSGSNMTVIEGNSDDAVEQNTYDIADAFGFVSVSAAYADYAGVEEVETETYTASADGVTVTVTAPVGALPENAELTVTMLSEDSAAYAEAAEAVGYDAEDEDTGMAALDITFLADGQEVEPTQAVTVTIDASAILPEEADASTIEVQHLEQTGDGVEPVLVADASEGVDAEAVVAEFEVEGFSSFTITWKYGNMDFDTASVTLNVYDSATNELISSSTDSISTTSFTATNGLSISTLTDALTVTGYEYSYATVTYTNNYSSGTVGSSSSSVTSISKANGYGGSYTITYGSSTQTASGITAINLYYTSSGPSVSISANEDDEGYTLTATTSGFSEDATITYTWTVDDTSSASIFGEGATATLTWGDDVADGTSVTVTVTATYGTDETATATYTLVKGGSYSFTVSNSALTLYVVDTNGNIISSATQSTTTGSANTEYTGTTLAGYFSVDDYTYYAAYTDATLATEIYSVRYNGSTWQYRTSSTGDWMTLDTATVYLVYYVAYEDQLVTDTTSGTYKYYHIDIRISGTFNVTVSDSVSTGSDITVTKIWVDDSSETRPSSGIVVYLMKYNEDTETWDYVYINEEKVTATLTADGNWSCTWEALSLEEGTYCVTEDDVSGYTMTDYTTFEVSAINDESSSTSTSTTGTLTVTELSSVYILKSDGTKIYVSMRPGSTSDENDSTQYEYQSVYGHKGYSNMDGSYGPFDLEDGDYIVVVVSFTYTYTVNGVEYTDTIENFEIKTYVSDDTNECDIVEKDEYKDEELGFDVVLEASEVLELAGVTTEATATLTNTLDEETSTDVTIKKVDSSGKDLSGATFTLMDNSTSKYYSVSENVGSWSTVEVGDTAPTITLDSITVTLADGTYTLTEVTAPDGYNLLTSSISITVSGGKVTDATYGGTDTSVVTASTDGLTVTVKNTAGTVLPNTGGMGTWLYTLAGLVLCGGAALVLYRRKRLS